MIDELRNGFEVLFSDFERVGFMFFLAFLFFVVVCGVEVLPLYTHFVHNPYMNQCGTVAYLNQPVVFVAFLHYFKNSFLTQAMIACSFTHPYPLNIAYYYLEMCGAVFLAAYVGIVVLNLNG